MDAVSADKQVNADPRVVGQRRFDVPGVLRDCRTNMVGDGSVSRDVECEPKRRWRLRAC